jgi:hypothetical protein
MSVCHAQQAQSHQGLDEELAQAECMQRQDQRYICNMQGHDYGHDLYSCREPWGQVA